MSKTAQETHELLTVQEAADFLHVSPGTIRRWAYQAQLKGKKIGPRGDWRFTKDDLEMLAVPNPLTEQKEQKKSIQMHAPHNHRVQFYDNDAFLITSIRKFVESADASIVIATPEHRAKIEKDLSIAGLSIEEAKRRGIYHSLDAEETLGRFMVGNTPDPKRFADVVSSVVKRAVEKYGTVHAFGEMVALLWSKGNPEAAIALEKLWNELQKKHPFKLHCAYPMDKLVGESYAESFREVCDEHSSVRPAKERGFLEEADDRNAAILQQKDRSYEQSRLFGIMARTIPGIVAAYDIHTGSYLYINDGITKILGYQPAEFLQGGVEFATSLVHPDDLPDITTKNLAALEEANRRDFPEIVQFEYRMRHKDGSWRWLHTDGSVFSRRRDGTVESVLNVLIDITDRKRTEELLRLRMEQEPTMLEAIVQSSDDAIVSKTLDGVIRSWNQGAENIFGYTAAEAIGRHISLIIPRERLDEETLIISRLRRGERIDHFDTQRIRKDGRLVDISLTVSPIKNAHGEIIGASKIARDVSDRKRHETMLREEEKRKDEFLAVLAHELRNPLSPIASGAEMLQLEESLSQNGQEAVGVIQRQVEHMVRLIDDLLDVSRIKRGTFMLRKEQLDLRDVVRSAIETSQAAIRIGGHRLVTSFAPGKLGINGDNVRLVQAISNLLINAARYTPQGGTIWLETGEKNGEAIVSVRDTGIGIDEKILPRVFDMFVQGKQISSVNRGLGIGLTLVKRLVEMHGGSIDAESPGKNLGSTFTIRLPLAAHKASDPNTFSPKKPTAVSARRILIVDDNRDALAMLAATLRMQDNEVAVASDGLEAVKAVQEFLPDVILMDIGMPNMNGYEAAKLIRAQSSDRSIKLIAVTGWGQKADKVRAREAGFDAHITKPVDSKILAQLLS